jgi:hypothetical protein
MTAPQASHNPDRSWRPDLPGVKAAPLPRYPRTVRAGVPNGLPEPKRYVYRGSNPPESGSPVAETHCAGYSCTECGAPAVAQGTVRPQHRPGCPRAKRLAAMRARKAAA